MVRGKVDKMDLESMDFSPEALKLIRLQQEKLQKRGYKFGGKKIKSKYLFNYLTITLFKTFFCP